VAAASGPLASAGGRAAAVALRPLCQRVLQWPLPTAAAQAAAAVALVAAANGAGGVPSLAASGYGRAVFAAVKAMSVAELAAREALAAAAKPGPGAEAAFPAAAASASPPQAPALAAAAAAAAVALAPVTAAPAVVFESVLRRKRVKVRKELVDAMLQSADQSVQESGLDIIMLSSASSVGPRPALCWMTEHVNADVRRKARKQVERFVEADLRVEAKRTLGADEGWLTAPNDALLFCRKKKGFRYCGPRRCD